MKLSNLLSVVKSIDALNEFADFAFICFLLQIPQKSAAPSDGREEEHT